MGNKIINIKDDFSEFPFGRNIEEGEYCGDVFRKNLLLPALKECDNVTIILDGAKGLGPSFLEQSFGGLIRYDGFKKDEVIKKINIVSTQNRSLIDEIHHYIKTAKVE